jgi:hypothetical protein
VEGVLDGLKEATAIERERGGGFQDCEHLCRLYPYCLRLYCVYLFHARMQQPGRGSGEPCSPSSSFHIDQHRPVDLFIFDCSPRSPRGLLAAVEVLAMSTLGARTARHIPRNALLTRSPHLILPFLLAPFASRVPRVRAPGPRVNRQHPPRLWLRLFASAVDVYIDHDFPSACETTLGRRW